MPAFGLMPLTKITPEVVQRFIAERSELSPKRIKNLLVTLGLIWKAARASGYVRTDVLQALRLPESRRPKRRFFTADECRKLFSFAEEPYKTMFWLDASTGLRAGELFGLRVEDIDLDAGMLRVEQSIWKREVNSTKTQAGERSFPIGPSLVRHLREFLIDDYRQNDLGLLCGARRSSI
jgi:integrase